MSEGKVTDKATQCDKKKNTGHLMLAFHLAIGLGFMLVFPLLNPIAPITEVGMRILGVFIGMVYLWSAVDSIWPSLLGLLLMGLSGIVAAPGYAGVKQVALDAFGTETVIVIMLSMILFGGVEFVGCTQYLARWFMTRKVINGRPYIFMFIFFFASYFLSGLTSPMASLLILWAIATNFLDEFGIEKCDKLYPIFIVGVYFSATLGQPMFPFKGAALVITGAFTKVTGVAVNYLAYVSFNWIMSIMMMVIYIALIKYVFKPDLSKLKNINTEQFSKQPLPPMNLQQKMFLGVIVLYIALLLAPSFLPATIGVIAFLKKIGTLGVTIFCLVILMIVPFQGKPVMPFKAVAAKNYSWDVYFLVAAAIYGANAISADATGIKLFLIDFLQPLLGGKPQIIFVLLILAFALITTNFANNAGMAVVLLPIIIAFSDQYPGVDATAIFMCVCMMVFVAILTPAASPYAGMLHARKDLVAMGDIVKIGFPLCVAALFLYALVGFPIAMMLFK